MALCTGEPDGCTNASFPVAWREMTFPCDMIGYGECLYAGQKKPAELDDPRTPYCGPVGREYEYPANAVLCGYRMYPWYYNKVEEGHDVAYQDGAGTYLRRHHDVDTGLPLPVTYGWDTSVFQSEGTAFFHFLISNPEQLHAPFQVDTCVNEEPWCPTIWGRWIGQVKWCGGGEPWAIECIKGLLVTETDDWPVGDPPAGDPQWCRQFVWRDVPVPYSTVGLVSVMYTLGKGTCFPYRNHYCLIDYCGDEFTGEGDERRFWCIGDSGGSGSAQGNGADDLDVTWDVAFSADDTFKKANVYDTHIKNAILKFATDLITRLDKPGHDSYLLVPESFQPFLWLSTEVWDDNHEDVPHVHEAYPRVLYGVNYPPGSFSIVDPIPIVGRAWLSGIEYPMELRLMSAVTRIEMYHETLESSEASRMFATMTLTVYVEKWLSDAAYDVEAPFQFLAGPSDPTDHRFVDPDNPGQEHSHERLEVYGPNGERVPSKVVWRGARLPSPLGFGVEFVLPCDTWHINTLPLSTNAVHCCETLQTIDKSPIYGQFTDMREKANVTDDEYSQLYEGWCALSVRNLNGTGLLGVACRCDD